MLWMENHESESDIIQIQLRTQAVIYLILAVTQSLFALILSFTCANHMHAHYTHTDWQPDTHALF